MNEKVRFLVLRGGAIGDFILTLPALTALRERWPEAYIELVGYPHIANLALAAGLVDHVESLDRADVARFFAQIPQFTQQQAEHISSFHLVISYLHDRVGTVKHNLLMAGAKQVIYGSPIVSEGHAIDHLVKPLETLAIYVAGANPRLALGENVRRPGREWLEANGLGKAAVAIHPGSGSPAKNWPVERFVELAERIAKSGKGKPFFVLGEADHAIAPVLAERAGHTPALTGRTLVDVASVLASCRAYVGNDSGITHIAAALGIPTIALFGSSDPDRWGPRGENVRILRADDGKMESITRDQVEAAVAGF